MNDRDERQRQTAARRERTMARVLERAQHGMEDTRFDRLRAPGPRRAVIVLWAVLVLGIGALTLVDNVYLTVALFAVGGGAAALLRAIVRAVPDLPDEVLDERQVVRRDRAYRTAYQVVVSLGMLVILLLYILSDGNRPDYDVQPAHLNAVFMVLLFGGFGLPSAVYAWSEKEL